MLNNTNIVVLSGKLTRDPELKYTKNGTAIAEFGVAINETWEKDGEKKESTTFLDCKAWSALAEKTGALKKGDSAVVVGKLRVDSWEDKETKKKRYKTYVLAEAVTNPYAGSVKKGAALAQRQAAPKPAPAVEEDDSIPFSFILPWLTIGTAAASALIA